MSEKWSQFREDSRKLGEEVRRGFMPFPMRTLFFLFLLVCVLVGFLLEGLEEYVVERGRAW